MASKAQKAEAESRCERVIEHLLKLAYSTARQPREQWKHTVRLHRHEVARLGIGVRDHLERRFVEIYERARRRVERSMKRFGEQEALRILPEECPWTLDEILAPDFEPDWHWRLRSDPGA